MVSGKKILNFLSYFCCKLDLYFICLQHGNDKCRIPQTRICM